MKEAVGVVKVRFRQINIYLGGRETGYLLMTNVETQRPARARAMQGRCKQARCKEKALAIRSG